ncbi:hypothetical protein PAXRUDRAFT_29061 [Paxillus rubicundulus Ve08.2h10]|uniref:Uncharacterized protein n=1 Tax=Paxillus rubicundulus Ve08.2h10 TaxID=930991 RepID=A0A0D0BWD0_9AGAM|nr:hypothetical protein PAXRUDRAFT_29061 [Paxillus rubicundulus Ve08.2h10]
MTQNARKRSAHDTSLMVNSHLDSDHADNEDRPMGYAMRNQGNMGVSHVSSHAASGNGGMPHLCSHAASDNSSMLHLHSHEGPDNSGVLHPQAHAGSDNSHMSSHTASVQEVPNDKYDSPENG